MLTTFRRAALAALALAACALLHTSARASADPLGASDMATFNSALAQLGLSAHDLNLPASELGMWGNDKYTLNVMSFLRSDILRCGPYARSTSAGLITNAGNLGNLVTAAHSRLDNGIRLGLVDDPLATYRKRVDDLGPECLATALAELTGGKAETYSKDPAYATVPLAVRRAAALVLFTVPEAQRDRQMGLVNPILKLGLDPQQVYTRVTNFAINTFAEEDDTTGHEVVDDRADAALVESLLDNVDWNYINRASTLLAIASQEAYKMTLPPPAPVDPKADPNNPPKPDPAAEAAQKEADAKFMAELEAEFNFQVKTPLGVVRLCGNGADAYPAANYLLTIDTGGNDTYAAAGASDFAHPVSVSIDRGGNDRYAFSGDDDAYQFGAGIFGTGILIDAAGDDTYNCGYAGEGAGIFGTGVLYDMGGNDTYNSYGFSQASGTFGSGILADLNGDDVYKTYKNAQGFGGTRGCGLLLDVAGNDQYLANMTDHFNGGLYGAKHHVHFVQGSAEGRRADIVDGHSWAGGYGILVDGAGNDNYIADCYGQGNAYWDCVGLLADKAGNDTYRAGQYSQASAPHFACGILQDDAGDDKYIISIRQSQAHGRDLSIAWLEDSAGNDWYQGARTTLGVSHVNAISVFWDKAGDDTYIMKGPGLGDSEPEPNGSIRDWLLTLGVFIDGGGHDGYYLLPGDESYEASNTYMGDVKPEDLAKLTPLDFAGDGKTWLRTVPTDAVPGYRGIGVDLP